MRRAFVEALVAAASMDERIVLLTGDLGFMALEPFRDQFPDRFFNMGVAEQNMVGVATGLAEAGCVPFCYSIVPFAVLRPFEFIRNGPVFHGLPVRIVGMGGGFDYGNAGPTHYGIEDVGAMRLLQGLAVIAPADARQVATVVSMLSDWSGPAYLRLGKQGETVAGLDGRFEFGKVQRVRHGSDAVVLAMGGISTSVVEAAESLEAGGISVEVVVVSSVNPCPVEDILGVVSSHRRAVTVEAHVMTGGLGSLVAEVIADHGVPCRLLRIAVEEPYGRSGGSQSYLHALHGISTEALVTRVSAFVGTDSPS
jgi:transketolase